MCAGSNRKKWRLHQTLPAIPYSRMAFSCAEKSKERRARLSSVVCNGVMFRFVGKFGFGDIVVYPILRGRGQVISSRCRVARLDDSLYLYMLGSEAFALYGIVAISIDVFTPHRRKYIRD